jgi:hypothetical protein
MGTVMQRLRWRREETPVQRYQRIVAQLHRPEREHWWWPPRHDDGGWGGC